ncbi:MAG: GNAT family N-acetyltransferase [Propionicimonas sp.]|uniref:GNAT family N-acetyltransferase n=1 Tax=Propionicimonas sp. TaxID=1955623 RepID=UPI003D1035BD
MDAGFLTPRLSVRRFLPTDGPGLHAYLSRPEAVAFEPYPVQSADACERLAAERARDPDFWAVCLGDVLIGNLYLHPEEPVAWRTWELGYVFHPDHWGRGYAHESAAALLDRCFAQGAHRVVAHCDPANPASWRLLERLGLRREGHLRQNASFASDAEGRPVWKDTYPYAVLASEWPQSADRVRTHGHAAPLSP